MKNAIQWPLMIEAIYDSFETGDHSGDEFTRRIMDKVVSWLVKGKKLSPNLRKALLKNIDQRTHFIVENAPETIRLTDNQKRYVRKTKPEWVAIAKGDDDQDIPDECETGVNGVKQVTNSDNPEDVSHLFHACFTPLSQAIHASFTAVSRLDPVAALALAQDLVAEAQKCVTLATRSSQINSPISSKGKVMEGKARNHDGSMTSASPFHEEGAIAPGLHDGTEPPSIRSGNEEGLLGHRTPGAKQADALTIWVKEDKRKGKIRATGNLDIAGTKFPLSFNPFYGELEALPRTQDNAAWLAMMGKEVADLVVPEEARGSSVAAYSTMSGLYAADDTHCFKKPVADQQVVILHWEENKPVSATIIDGEIRTAVPIRHEQGDRYKGAVKLT